MSRYISSLFTGFCFILFNTAFAVDFQEGWNLEKGGSSSDVQLVDIDQDGDLDAYIADQNNPDTLWLNDGTGQFTRSPQTLSQSIGISAAFGLLDAGTYPDLFLGALFAPSQVWLNDGAGTLVDSGQSVGSGGQRGAVKLGLLDDDSTLDAFVLTNGGADSVFFNDGDGNFTDSLQELGADQGLDLVLIDLGEDANGDVDAVVANNSRNRVWFNDGDGNFTESAESMLEFGTFGVAVGLLDNDAVLDIFFANGSNSGNPNSVYLGDGDGTFTKTGQSLGDNYSVSVLLHDFDGQNGPDAFVGNNSGVMDRLWLNDGSGNFSDSGLTLGFGAAFGSAMGLINNDAHMDVILANRYQPDQVWYGDGAGGFTNSGQALGSFEAGGMALADVDGDDDLDAVIGATGGTARVFLNDGGAQFTDSNQWLVTGLGNNIQDVALADLDGVNGVDVFLQVSPQGGAGNYSNRVFFNNGSGVFSDSGQTLGTFNSGATAIGDVDGDDEPDIFVGNAPYNAETGANNLWLNDGGVFTLDPQDLGTGNTRAAALLDLDGDDDLDLFIGNSSFGSGNDPANLIYLNGEGSDAEGVFTDSGQTLGTGNSFSVAFGLLDDDDHIDMFVGNIGGNTVWLGDGAGNFTDSGQSLGNSNTLEVHLFDADDDNDLDVFATNGNASSQANRIWINDGDGNFSSSGLALGNARSQGSGLGDLNGDTLPDVFVSNGEGDLRVWLNNTVIVRQQEITPSPSAQEASIGDPVSIEVSYSTSNDEANLSGVGVRIHWNSSELTLDEIASVLATDLSSSDNSCQSDNLDFDADPDTDCFAELVWASGTDEFPGEGNLPASLFTAEFTANVPFSQTTFVKFSESSLAATYTLNANAATVTNPDSGQPEFDPGVVPGTPLGFGDVSTTGVSGPQIIPVDNNGTGPLTLDCQLSGNNPGDFDIDVCPSPVAAGGATQVRVLCDPVTSGLREASLDIATNDTDEPSVSYPLNCTGIDLPEFDSDIDPGIAIDLGATEAGTTSAAQALRVVNRGRANLTLVCDLSGPDAGEFQITACPSPVGVINPEDVLIVCEPGSTGNLSASLDITTNDLDEMVLAWPLSCVGEVPGGVLIYRDGFEPVDQ